jgi:hypothetical protein
VPPLHDAAMGIHAEAAEVVEFGAEAPTVEVRVFEHGRLAHRELCETAEAAEDVVERWAEVEGMECVVDDLATRHRSGQILEPDEERATDEEYPRIPASQEASP